MKVVIESYREGRWREEVSFTGKDMMGQGRDAFYTRLRSDVAQPLRLIVVHHEHNGTSESAREILKHNGGV